MPGPLWACGAVRGLACGVCSHSRIPALLRCAGAPIETPTPTLHTVPGSRPLRAQHVFRHCRWLLHPSDFVVGMPSQHAAACVSVEHLLRLIRMVIVMQGKQKQRALAVHFSAGAYPAREGAEEGMNK